MRKKIILFLTFIFTFLGSNLTAQTVSGVPSNTGCQNTGIVTASSIGLGAAPQYQLLKAGVVIAPILGDASQYTNINVFTGLSSGSYTLNAKATAGGTVFSSSVITVADGYTPMTVTTPTTVTSCVGNMAVLTSAVTNGKAPFVYTIATQKTPGAILQSSGAIASSSFSFNALPTNSYIVSVTDACGQTITGATSIANPTVGVNDLKIASIAYPGRSGLLCTQAIRLYIEKGFVYTASGSLVSAADAALFRWKIKYKGQLYGKDINGDGYADVGGDGFLLTEANPIMPINASRANVVADIANMRVVLMDMCGGSKEFPVTNYNTSYSYITLRNCGGSAIIKSNIGAGLDCLPLNLTFTNETNPADVHNFTVTTGSETFTDVLTPGANYKVTYSDGEGFTSGLFNPSSSRLLFTAAPTFTAVQSVTAYTVSLNDLDYGYLYLSLNTSQPTDILSYTVTASNNPLVPVGYSYSAALSTFNNGNIGVPLLPSPNAGDPQPFWPKGNYTLQVNSDCGSATANVVVQGRTASLSDNTITSICGGFNYVMNGKFDDASAYQVVIVSGPSSVGQVRDLASTTASLPFNGLSYGTYVFGLRIKGGTKNVLTQTVTYDANNAIIVDKANTGGYVCASGSKSGVLTIVATSNSPAPKNVLEYALSTDGGSTYGAYQSGNTFGGLTDATYFFRIKDGCGNEITQSVQIGVAAAPTATVNGLLSPAIICNATTGTLQLDVDAFGALSYLWKGPGINASNQGLKSPIISYQNLMTGANNYSCAVTMGAPCNATTTASLVININAFPNLKITTPAQVCTPDTVDITAEAITAGSEKGLTYTYFADKMTTIPLSNPNAIAVSNTYYIKGTNAIGCSIIAPVEVTVSPLPVATISYLGGPFCKTGKISVVKVGTAGGTYTSDAGLSIDAATGEINLETSTIGDHTITYSFSEGNCSGNTTTALITINALPTATISYPNAVYCNRGTATVVQTGITNGLYSSDNGLSIDASTGEIDLVNSTLGAHTISYKFTNGTCSNTTTAKIVINSTTVLPVLEDIKSECSITPLTPTVTDPCAGTISGTTTTSFPITAQGTTVVTWEFDYGNGDVKTVNQNVIIKSIALLGSESTTCLNNGNGYSVSLSVTGQGPYTVTGTGAPGIWSGNTWTSGTITSGIDYDVNIQGTNSCNTLNVKGNTPNCCSFNVVCPTFAPTTVSCYSDLPIETSLTEAQFEALGNGDGNIANNHCGVIEITASNSPDQGCNSSITRTYTITEYEDANGNGLRDTGEDNVLNTAVCNQIIVVHDTKAPVFNEPLPESVITADCNNIPEAITLTASDNCGSATVAYTETHLDGDCSSKYSLVRNWIATDDCDNQTTFTQTINVVCLMNIYNAISPNGDGKNDRLKIEGIDCFPNNTVRIYNRYGVIVYEKKGYDNVTNPFEGFSDGRATVLRKDKLPTGTYFYTIEYDDSGTQINKSGYIYVNNQ